MTILVPKRSTEAVLYSFDWTRDLAPTSDTLQSFTLVRSTGTVTIGTTANTDKAVTAILSGGADGETATFLLTVVTTGGQTLARDLSLTISDGSTAIYPSTNTKRQLVEMAFEEIGLAGYEFDATPEEQASTLRRLDALMAEWAGPGVNLDVGYNFPPIMGGSDLDDASGVPDFAMNIVAIKLAIRIMPAIGKTMSPETSQAMSAGWTGLRNALAVIPNRTLPRRTIRGAGAKPWGTWNPFQQAGNG